MSALEDAERAIAGAREDLAQPPLIPRTTEQIHDEIFRVATVPTADFRAEDLAEWNAELGRLWREMARAANREKQPPLTLAAALLADDYDRRAEEYRKQEKQR